MFHPQGVSTCTDHVYVLDRTILEETSRQVRLMGQLYSRSELDRAWLGDGASNLLEPHARGEGLC